MGSNLTPEQFKQMNLIDNGDGTYSMQGRAVKNDGIKSVLPEKPAESFKERSMKLQEDIENYPDKVKWNPPVSKLRKLSLKLFGVPMPKQSVKSHANGAFKITKTGKKVHIVNHYQPEETKERAKDYIKQIKEQMPENFTPFSKEVFVTKFHCIYPPLKSFHRQKGKMERIRNGEIFYKNTQPDLIDNLKKLVFDCLGKDKKTGIPLVLSNDGIIVGEDDTRKYYGTGGCIIIELEGC